MENKPAAFDEHSYKGRGEGGDVEGLSGLLGVFFPFFWGPRE